MTRKTVPGKAQSSKSTPLPPYGDPARPINGQFVGKRNPDSGLIKHWAYRLRSTGAISKILEDIEIKVRHEEFKKRMESREGTAG